MMKTRSFLAFALFLAALPRLAGAVQPFEPGWSQDALWDDGRAEVAHYDARRVIYGEPRPHEEVRITVAEPMRTDTLVKADPPYGDKPILPVLKVNIFARVETGNYPYHLMTTLLVRRDRPDRVAKATYSSQEWCGITLKDLRLMGNAPTYRINSYWDGQAVDVRPVHLPDGALLMDQLPTSLRSLDLPPTSSLMCRVVPSLVGNKAPRLRALKASITRQPTEGPIEAAGRAWAPDEVIHYRLEAGDEIQADYWFAAETPRPLLRYETSTGEAGTLTKLERRAYWAD